VSCRVSGVAEQACKCADRMCAMHDVRGSCAALLHNLKMKVDGVMKQKHSSIAVSVYHTELNSSSADVADKQRLASGMAAGVQVQSEEGEQEGGTAAEKPSKAKRRAERRAARESGLLPPNSSSLRKSVEGQLSMLALAEHEWEADTEKLASGTCDDGVVSA
jgi:hypothetical protein